MEENPIDDSWFADICLGYQAHHVDTRLLPFFAKLVAQRATRLTTGPNDHHPLMLHETGRLFKVLEQIRRDCSIAKSQGVRDGVRIRQMGVRRWSFETVGGFKRAAGLSVWRLEICDCDMVGREYLEVRPESRPNQSVCWCETTDNGPCSISRGRRDDRFVGFLQGRESTASLRSRL